MQSWLFRFFLSSFMAYGVLSAGIVQTSNLLVVEETINKASPDALFVWDVDDVLVTCSDPVLRLANKEKFEKICRTYVKKLSAEEYERLYSIVYKSRGLEIVDRKVYDVLRLLLDKNLKTIALTHTKPGPMGLIEKLEDLRVEELRHLGLNFEILSPFMGESSLNSHQDTESSTVIKKGIIFTADAEKGRALEEVLKSYQLKPSQIIFIDDRLDNLKSVEAFCKRNQIEFFGFEYTAVKEHFTQKVDEKLIEIQLNVLIQEGQWITPEEAAETFNDTFNEDH